MALSTANAVEGVEAVEGPVGRNEVETSFHELKTPPVDRPEGLEGSPKASLKASPEGISNDVIAASANSSSEGDAAGDRPAADNRGAAEIELAEEIGRLNADIEQMISSAKDME